MSAQPIIDTAVIRDAALFSKNRDVREKASKLIRVLEKYGFWARKAVKSDVVDTFNR